MRCCKTSCLIMMLICPILVFAKDVFRHSDYQYFNRIANFPVFQNTNIEQQTNAEIVDATADGLILVYTDSESKNLGFVDISDPYQPQARGVVALDGEPTSVSVFNRLALVGVNTTNQLSNPTGLLQIIDIDSQKIIRSLDLGGQPDAISISPDQQYAAIAIENERDEDAGDGRPPQFPAGFLVIVDLDPKVENFRLRQVDLTGIATLFPEDPEPEFIDINAFNVAAITLQENNEIVFVHLPTGKVINHFSAGVVDLFNIDTVENDLIEFNSHLLNVPREPDGITYLSPFTLATADEGDLDGGSRGFSIFDAFGNLLFNAGNSLERAVSTIGHYPENRSENKGNEPENLISSRFGNDNLLFVGSERANVVLVYELIPSPILRQILPAGVGPEGLLAIPSRGLLVSAAEVDDRENHIRSIITIYQRQAKSKQYPTIIAKRRPSGEPIPWGGLSGLTIKPTNPKTAFAIHDSVYQKSRIYRLNLAKTPTRLNQEILLKDRYSRLQAIDTDLVNDDLTVNLDLEGIATRANNGFWLVSEGAGTMGDQQRPFESLNLVLKVHKDGSIEDVITLPDSTNQRQTRFGLEGIAVIGRANAEIVFVAFQREWQDDPSGLTRIGRYDVRRKQWRFFYYPLDSVQSPNGGFVGLSEITALSDHEFAVIERDNQAGPDARLKKVYRFSIAGLKPLADTLLGITPSFPIVKKTLALDLMPILADTGGLILEKIEGLAVFANGDVLLVNDNDGVDDSNGETQLIRMPKVFK